jgi:hypothetical protein
LTFFVPDRGSGQAVCRLDQPAQRRHEIVVSRAGMSVI